MRKLIAGMASVGVALGGALIAPSAGATPRGEALYQPPPVQWGVCTDPNLVAAGAQCGKVVVPMDYSDPDGKKIKLAVSRIKHKSSDADYQGPMLVNPGGPGGSGLSLSVLGQYVPKNAGDDYDWIGFDPRGVGSSEPAVSCDKDYAGYNRPDYVPTTAKIEQAWLKKTKQYAEDCGEKNGDFLEHVKTIDTVRDMDVIRRALGEKKTNYYGFSYGTTLGQTYATVYPTHLRRAVFDGIVNPKDVWYQANLNQDVAFNHVIQRYFEWIARYDDVYHLGDTEQKVEDLFYAQKRRLDKTPAGGKIGSSEWTDLFLPAGYGTYHWDDIATGFSDWVHKGDWRQLKTLYDDAAGVGDDNGYAIYDAVQCTDTQWPTDWQQWKDDNWRIHKTAPFETWANAWYNAPCLNWPAGAGKPVEVDGSKAPPILLISEEEDAATPYAGALEVRKRFPKSSLISLPGGTTHAGSLNGNACEDNQIADYLKDGTLPERQSGNTSDTQCAPLPQPVPAAAQSSAKTQKLKQPAALVRQLQTSLNK